MACYDPDTDEYQSVCRVMSGFSDAFCIEVLCLHSENPSSAPYSSKMRVGCDIDDENPSLDSTC
ncbi:putative DNA ligase (ATP) [Helianthus annuus]|nr:putative DNA ligase (ATP) [Helianthus annuus]